MKFWSVYVTVLLSLLKYFGGSPQPMIASLAGQELHTSFTFRLSLPGP
jgi:hypothetical protein